jgi:hypothetical protein
MGLSEIAPSAPKIDRIISRIEEGDIKIPAFQRGFVWNQDQVIDLLDSIYHDYPLGSILLWNSNERLRSTRNVGEFLIPDREPQYPVNYVLDGQPRLSTIYSIFDGLVKSPYAALCCILRHCGVQQSTPHSSEFARLAYGAFYKTACFLTFYEFIIFDKNKTRASDASQYKIDTEIFDIYFDLNEKQFLDKNSLKTEHINLKLNVQRNL